MFDFDGPNQLVIMRAGAVELDSIDLYSRWKEWVALSDNAKFLKAFEIVGGEPTSPTNRVPTFLFTINGWKIRPQEADHTLTITGNLANENGIGSPFVPTLGNFQVVLEKNTSTAPTVSVNTGSGLTAEQSAWLQQLWQDQGLDSNNPLTINEDGSRSSAGIDIDAVTTGTSPNRTTTLTRQ